MGNETLSLNFYHYQMKLRTKTELADLLYRQGFDWISFYLVDGKIQWNWHLGSVRGTGGGDLAVFTRISGLYDLTRKECRQIAANMYKKAEAAIESPEYASHIDIFDNL